MPAVPYGTCTKQAGPFTRNPAHVAANDTFVPYEINLAALVDSGSNAIDVIGGAALTTGLDIVVTDINGVAYPRIIPTFNKATPVGLLIVQLPAVNTVTGSAAYYLQWGGASVANSALVFQDCYGGAADFEVVYTGNEAAGNITDWSGNGYTGTAAGVGYGAAAQVGTGLDFEAGDAGDVVSNATALNFERTQPFTFLTWAKHESVGASAQFITRREVAGNTRGISINFAVANPLYCTIQNQAGNRLQVYSTDVRAVGTEHWGVSYAGNSIPAGVVFIKNGATTATVTAEDTLGATCLNAMPCAVGRGSDLSSQGYDGILNYVRVVKAALSANQIATAYNNEYGYATNTGVVMTGAAVVSNTKGQGGGTIVGIGIGIGF